MQEGHDNTASLPHGSWQDLPRAHQFLAAIQWFIVDTFGPAPGNGSFMYRALAFIRSRLDNRLFCSAWPSIAKRPFSIVIINLVHEVWNILFTWEEGALKVPIYHLANNTRVETTGAAPFSNVLARTESIDMALSVWIASVTRRFPGDYIEQANAFSDIIPEHWDHIIAREGTHNAAQDGRLIDHTPASRHGGDPDNPQ